MKHPFTQFSKVLLSTLAITLYCSFVTAQSFTVSPSNSVSTQIYENGFGELNIDLTNVSGSSMIFEWETLTNGLDANWSQVFCDYQSCFSYVPASGTMTAVNDGEKGFIKLTIGVGTNLGTGTATFRVWPQGDTASAQTLTFSVDALVGVEDEFAGSLEIFPNPVSDVLYVQNNVEGNEIGQLRIIDLNGAVVFDREIQPNEEAKFDLSELASGMYMVRFTAGEKSTSRRILKVD